MNRDQLKGSWKQISGALREKWGKLTDNDLTAAEGHRDILAGKIQEHYGLAKEEAERQLNEFFAGWHDENTVAIEGGKLDTATLKKGM